MIIDRHNYEEFFLLYIDNELTVEQKKQVDLFVQENTDLEEELVMLKQSRLVPDDSIVFDKKHLLMKEENNSFINLTNYEEWLVLYVDDELNAEEKTAVEKFAEAHPHVQQELALFQQTKSQPEKIVFESKEILYRREKTVRVISMQWWKVAVAAVLIISAGVTIYPFLTTRNNGEITNKEVAKVEKKQTSISEKAMTVDTQQQPTTTNEQKEQLAVSTGIEKQTETKAKQQTPLKEENNQQLAYNDLRQNTDEVKTLQPSTVEINQPTIEQPKMNDAVAIENKMHKENINTDPVTIPAVKTPDNSNTSDDVQYASNDTENKRLRGFFRKATRIIERTTNINPANDDNKVLIGGMAINLK